MTEAEAIRQAVKKERDEVANVITFDDEAYKRYAAEMGAYDKVLEIIDKQRRGHDKKRSEKGIKTNQGHGTGYTFC